MVNKKIHSGVTYFISIIFGLCLSLSAQDINWENMTSFNDVRTMKVINDTLYIASSGGILAITDPILPGRKIINTDGLGTTDITDIIKDANGQKWVTGFGRLIKFDFENSQQFIFKDRDDNFIKLHRVVDDGDNLWVGTDIGLVLFSKINDGGQIQDSYELFGDLNPSPAVYDIFLKDDSIYLATSNGVAVADRSIPTLLNSPLNWKTFGMLNYSELGNDTILSVVNYGSQLYAATPRAVVVIDIDGETVTPVNGLTDLENARLNFVSDSLFVYFYDITSGGIGVIEDGIITTMLTTSLKPITGLSYNNARWFASSEGGIYSGQTDFQIYSFTGLQQNDIEDLAINQAGQISVGYTTGGAAIQLADLSWSDLPIFRDATLLMTDSMGNPWFGTFGEGLWVQDGNGFVNYDEQNSSMIGNTDNPPFGLTFVVINGLETDGEFLYAACYRAANGYPIVYADMNNLDNINSWDSLGLSDGINNEFVVSLDVYGNSLAVGTEAIGLYMCDLGSDPFDHSDIIIENHTVENMFLISNSIRVVEFSPEGNLWVGTNFGLSRYDPGFEFYVDIDLPEMMSSDVTDLEFDGRGNLWIGSVNGLGFRNATTGEIIVYNSENSGLVSNRINNVTFDSNTGDTYISTPSGISKILSFVGTPTAQLENVIAFPNPFVISNQNDVLSFNYARSGTVRIYTVAGEEVDAFPINNSWDGTNQKDQPVASGVYLFILSDDEGNISRGKILLVRE